MKPKQNQQTSEGASSYKKNNFDKNTCPYCAKGFHLEDNFMKKQIDQLSSLLKQHNIAPPREKNPMKKHRQKILKGVML